jgi:hypothetical protein
MALYVDAVGAFLVGTDGARLQDGLPTSGFLWQDTIISHYANAPILTTWIESIAACIDPAADFLRFLNLIWNVDTAEGYGLDVWGRIVGVGRVLQVGGKYFGFEEGDPQSYDPFYQSPFYDGPTIRNNYVLVDTDYRRLIFAKALCNISNGSVPSINRILLTLFPGRGVAYVREMGNMAMAFVFDFELTPVEYAIVTQSGVLPRSTGVSLTLRNQNG